MGGCRAGHPSIQLPGRHTDRAYQGGSVQKEGYRIEWSFGKNPDPTIEVWSTATLIEAVIDALLEEPYKLKLALEALQKSRPT